MADSAVIQDPGAFDSIPLMSIDSALSIGTTYLIPLQKHITNANGTRDQKTALAFEIRNACMEVGAFYSEQTRVSNPPASPTHF